LKALFPDPDNLLKLAIKAAHEAGRLVREVSTRSLHVSLKSSPTDLVTEADYASEKLILQIIMDNRPDDGLIGEEGTSRPSRSGISWLIDPIDGTTNYVRGLPNYSISIAATSRNESVIGVVYDPTLEETFAAIRGCGATLNNTSIRCSTTPLAESIVGTGFSYSLARRARQSEFLRDVLQAVGDIRRPGSAAVSLCWVACGRLDAFYEVGLQPWDFAAGSLIALEAGADIQHARHGHEGEMIIASAPTVTAGLSQILRKPL
jgi:myo-inositol-1(or 4)-monophosphatase